MCHAPAHDNRSSGNVYTPSLHHLPEISGFLAQADVNVSLYKSIAAIDTCSHSGLSANSY
jgi:hypothetical protein